MADAVRVVFDKQLHVEYTKYVLYIIIYRLFLYKRFLKVVCNVVTLGV